MSSNKKYSEQDCIESLQEAAANVDKLTHSEYLSFRSGRELPSYAFIAKEFGSWNEAKEAANLPTYKAAKPKIQKPSVVNLSDEEWEKLEGTKRHYIKRKAYIAKWKVSNGCHKCGYDSNEAAIQVHHPDGRDGLSITEKGEGFEEMKEELENKCVPLCGNCHNIEHNEKDYLSI